MKNLILSFAIIFTALLSNATLINLTATAKQNEFFPAEILKANQQCPANWKTSLQAEKIVCTNGSDHFDIEYIKINREVIRLTGRFNTTCKKVGLNTLQALAMPCELIAQDSSNVGDEMVYTIKCDNFIRGEVTCKPNRIDYALGYTEAHRNLLKSAQNTQTPIIVDNQPYFKPVTTTKVQVTKEPNFCYRTFAKAKAVAISKKTGASQVVSGKLQYSADSKTLSSEFYCMKDPVQSKCPAGMTLKNYECQSDLRPISELCPTGLRIGASGTQDIKVNKDSIATEITELKRDCFKDLCYPNSFDNGKNCLMCPTGSIYSPPAKAAAAEAVCLKSNKI